MANKEAFWVAAATAAPVIGLAHAVLIGRALQEGVVRSFGSIYRDSSPRDKRIARRYYALYWIAAISTFGCVVVLCVSLYSLMHERTSALSSWTSLGILVASMAMLPVEGFLTAWAGMMEVLDDESKAHRAPESDRHDVQSHGRRVQSSG